MDDIGELLQFFAEGGEGEAPPSGAEEGAAAQEGSDPAATALAGDESAQETEDAERDARLRAHFDGLWRQAEALRELVPDFDLSAALLDPEFVRRTAPGALSVEDAWFSLHHRAYLRRQAEAITRRAREEAAQAVRSGSRRPRENGSAASAAVSAAPDLRAMTQRERRAYIMRKYPREM